MERSSSLFAPILAASALVGCGTTDSSNAVAAFDAGSIPPPDDAAQVTLDAGGGACFGTGWTAGVVLRDGVIESSNPPTSINGVQGVASDGGVAVVVWAEYTDATAGVPIVSQVRAAVCHAGTWGASTPIGSAHSLNPRVAIRSDGTAIMAWGEQQSDGTPILWTAILDPSTGQWDAPMLVGGAAVPAYPSSIATGDDGSALLVWGESGGMWASLLGGSGWGAPMELDGPTGTGVAAAVAAGDGKGAYVVAWEDDVSTYGIWARAFEAGAWGPTAVLSEGSLVTLSQDRSALAVNPSGDAVLSWYQTGDGGTSYQSATYARGTGLWSSPQTIATNMQSLSLAIDPRGRPVAGWHTPVAMTDAGPSATDYLAWAEAGDGGWPAPPSVSFVAQGAVDVTVAADGMGAAWAVWSTGFYPQLNVLAATFDPVQGLQAAQPIWATNLYDAPGTLSLDTSPGGNAIVALPTRLLGSSPLGIVDRVWAMTYRP